MVWSVRVPADWQRYGHWYGMVGYGMVWSVRVPADWNRYGHWYGRVGYGVVSEGA